MPFTVLKVSKSESSVVVEGEFATEDEAKDFAGDMQRNDLSNNHDYMVESPPPRAEVVELPL